MATKKQRRRRSKDRRHEWEYVYVDDEGQEVEVDEPEETPARKATQKGSKAPGRQPKGQLKGRSGRTVEPPSWQRALRRGAIFAPLMLIVVYLLQKKGDKNIPAALVQTAVLLAFFIPFTYVMDTIMYRTFRKRLERGGAAEPKRR